MNRRQFVHSAGAFAALGLVPRPGRSAPNRDALAERYAQLDAAARQPVLQRHLLPEPVILERIEFLRQGEFYLVRVRAKNGAVGVAVSNERDMGPLVPVAKQLMVPPLMSKESASSAPPPLA